MHIEDADTGEWENAEKKEKKKEWERAIGTWKLMTGKKIISGGQAGPLSTMLASWPCGSNIAKLVNFLDKVVILKKQSHGVI